GHRGTRKREKPVARWTGAFLLLGVCLWRATPPRFGGSEERRANPKPDQNWGRRNSRCLTVEYECSGLGYADLATRTWLCGPGYADLAMRTWLCGPGYADLATRLRRAARRGTPRA